MSERSFAKPLLIQNDNTRSLERIQFDDDFRDEDWLQSLLYEHPEILPFDELDPLFRDSVPLAREVESGSGPIDIVYGNDDGLITLVETKLWRNPGSRREVVAQLINYAAELTKMSYEDFASAIAYAAGSNDQSLKQRIQKGAKSFDEVRFHDGLTRNLKQGRFLLLIVGDGIREDVEGMREFLHRHPQMGFTLRLVEMAIYRLNPKSNDEIIVFPQVVAKTSEVVRAVVEVRGNQITVATPPESTEISGGGRFKSTPEQFFIELAKEVSPETVAAAKSVIEHAGDHRLTVQWMQGGPVFKYVDEETGNFYTLGQFHRDGDLRELFRLPSRCKESDIEIPDKVWIAYFEAIARLIPGASRQHGKYKTGKEWDDVVGQDDFCSLEPLLARKDEWLAAVAKTIADIREATKA